jgi:hypothetical protein
MALFSSKLCPWSITGESTCKENFIGIDSGGSKLGESCAKEDCIEGTCFRAKNETNGTCRHVLLTGDKGCKKENYVCTQGLKCYNNVCLQRRPKTTDKDDDDEPKENTTTNADITKYVLYGFIAVMILLLILMIILLVSQSQKSY